MQYSLAKQKCLYILTIQIFSDLNDPQYGNRQISKKKQNKQSINQQKKCMNKKSLPWIFKQKDVS